MHNFTKLFRQSVILLSLFLGLNAASEAQDYAPGYRTRLQPREMVQQPPAEKRQGFFDVIFGRREEARPAPRVETYQRNAAKNSRVAYSRNDDANYRLTGRERFDDNAYINPDLNYPKSKSLPNKKVAKPKTMDFQTTSIPTVGLYCVRSCDGFFFPISNPTKVTGETSSQLETCSSLCPNATMEVYKGGSSIETAVGPNRKSYLGHPKSYAYREKMNNSCSCKGERVGGLASLPFTRDYTLRTGDIVLMEEGVHQFKGSEDYPFKPRDFALLSRGSSRLSPDLRNMLESKNVAFGTTKAVQVASNKQLPLGDEGSTLADTLGLVSAKSVRNIDIFAPTKERPKMLIEIIQKQRLAQKL